MISRHIERAIRLGELQGEILNLLATLHLLLLVLHLRLFVAILYKLLPTLLGRLDAAEKPA